MIPKFLAVVLLITAAPSSSLSLDEIPTYIEQKDSERILKRVEANEWSITTTVIQKDYMRMIGARVGKRFHKRVYVADELFWADKFHGKQPTKVPKGLLRDLRKALKSIPNGLKFLTENHFLAVVPVRGIHGSASVGMAFSKDGERYGYYILVDLDEYETTFGNWLEAKLATTYTPEEAITITAANSALDKNPKASILRFLIFHELGHVADFTDQTDAFYDLSWKKIPYVRPEPIVFGHSFKGLDESTEAKLRKEISEIVEQAMTESDPLGIGDWASRFEDVLPQRIKLKFYMKNADRIDFSTFLNIYKNLDKTNLPTLYSATAAGEDFADSIATYIHVVLNELAYEVKVYKDDELVFTYRLTWEEERLKEKRKQVEAILGINS